MFERENDSEPELNILLGFLIKKQQSLFHESHILKFLPL